MYECVCVCAHMCVCVCAHMCVCARVLVPACVGSHAMLIWVMHMFPRVHCVHVHANVCVHVCVYARACVRMHARACAKLGVEGGGGGAHGAGSVWLYSLVPARTVWQWLYSTGGACECTFVNRIRDTKKNCQEMMTVHYMMMYMVCAARQRV